MLSPKDPCLLPKFSIRWLYNGSQFLSLFASFWGTGLALYDYANPQVRKPPLSIHAAVILPSLFFTAIAIFTTDKFQGQKIMEAGSHLSLPDSFNAKQAPRTRVSNLLEGSFIGLSIFLSIVCNYFLFAGLKGYLKQLSDPKHTYPIIPLNAIDMLFLTIKVSIDAVFNLSNGGYDAAAAIKQSVTKSSSGGLLRQLCLPLVRKRPLLAAIVLLVKGPGVFFHTMTDYLSLVLSIPSELFSRMAQIPALFFPVMSVFSVFSLYLIGSNLIQAFYFEGSASSENLHRLRRESLGYHEVPSQGRLPNPCFTLFSCCPPAKQVVRFGFLTQAPLHAFGDVFPVILLIKDLFDRHGGHPILNLALVLLIGIPVFAGSLLGTGLSEVRESDQHFQEDFEDVPQSAPRGCSLLCSP